MPSLGHAGLLLTTNIPEEMMAELVKHSHFRCWIYLGGSIQVMHCIEV